MSLIIVEGAENTGKSTLVERLLVRFPELVKIDKIRGPKTREVYLHELDKVFKYCFSGIPTIVDRFYFVELVYRAVLNDRPIAFSPADQDALEAIIKLAHPFLIRCHVPYEVMAKTYEERDQMIDLETNRIIQEEYERLLAFYVTEVIPWYYEYDFTQDDFEILAHLVGNYLKTTKGRNNYEYNGL